MLAEERIDLNNKGILDLQVDVGVRTLRDDLVLVIHVACLLLDGLFHFIQELVLIWGQSQIVEHIHLCLIYVRIKTNLWQKLLFK